MDLTKLSAPFDPAKISWRVGATNQDKSSGMALAYIDARDVMERLDNVCGPENWQCRYSHASQKTICDIGIRIGDEWVWKANGAGDSDVEAEKGASSDAYKRAAVLWGIGRYLYDIKSPWVDIKPKGRSFVIANPNDPKLRNALSTAHNGSTSTPPPEPKPTPAHDTVPTGRRTPDEPNAPEAEMPRMQDYVEMVALVKKQTAEPELSDLMNTSRFQEFKEEAPWLGGHLWKEAKEQLQALRVAGNVRAA